MRRNSLPKYHVIPKAPQLLKNTHANLIVQTETPVFGNEGIHRIGLCTEFNQHHSYGLWDTRSEEAFKWWRFKVSATQKAFYVLWQGVSWNSLQ